jgi:hypothetical protein
VVEPSLPPRLKRYSLHGAAGDLAAGMSVDEILDAISRFPRYRLRAGYQMSMPAGRFARKQADEQR